VSQETKVVEQHLDTAGKEHQLVVKDPSSSSPHVIKEVDTPDLASLLQQIYSLAQLRIHCTVGLDGSTSITHLSVGLPGMKEIVIQLPQPNSEKN
jgi:hypothetical protein